MGQGGYINIINSTAKTLHKRYCHSYQMNAWDKSLPDSIAPGEQQHCYIEFNQDIFKSETDDGAEVSYTVGNTNNKFNIKASGKHGFHLHVDWHNISEKPGYFVFPPQSSKNKITDLGWFHRGTISIIIGETGLKTAMGFPKSRYIHRFWQQYYAPVLDNLSLLNLTIPGTHDSGTYKIRSFTAAPWTKTQLCNIKQQLEQGTRCLDLRIGHEKKLKGSKKFILVHDVWRTSVTVVDALQQVLKFSRANPDEIIILDIHRFIELDSHSFDHQLLQQHILDTLKDNIISPNLKNKTLKQIKQATQARILVAYNHKIRDQQFICGIEQKWQNKKKDNIDNLEQFIDKKIKQQQEFAATSLWSLQAATSDGFYCPISLRKDLNQWFYGGNNWSVNANIIAVDYIDLTRIVYDCIVASLYKGAKVTPSFSAFELTEQYTNVGGDCPLDVGHSDDQYQITTDRARFDCNNNKVTKFSKDEYSFNNVLFDQGQQLLRLISNTHQYQRIDNYGKISAYLSAGDGDQYFAMNRAKTLVVGCSQSHISLYELFTERQLVSLPLLEPSQSIFITPAYPISISQNGTKAIISGAKSIYLYDFLASSSSKIDLPFKPFSHTMHDGHWVAINSREAIHIYHLDDHRIIATLPNSVSGNLDINDSGDYLAFNTKNNTTVVYDTSTWKILWQSQQHKNELNDVKFSEDGRFLMVLSGKSELLKYEMKVG